MLGKKVQPKFAGQWTVADLGAFYQQNRTSLVSYATRLLKNSARAEEVVQDALIKVLLASPELNSEAQAFAYMRKTVENLCLDIFRLEGRQPNLVVLDDASAEIDARFAIPDNSELFSSAEDAAIVRQALSMLSSAERAALVMWEMEGRSAKEIAKELGIKESAVRHTVSRARASLRRILSEYIIDEQRGLTALDLLSSSYRKAAEKAKKSSRVALSLILVMFAFLGFNTLSDTSLINVTNNERSTTTSTDVSSSSTFIESNQPEESIVDPTPLAETIEAVGAKSTLAGVNAKAAPLKFEGLDRNGVPTGLTVTDSNGSLGSLFLSARDGVMTETELMLSSIAKTKEGAANILLNQTITQDAAAVRYEATASFGREGRWIPLNAEVLSTEIERLMDGNYLLTATLRVKSEVETTIVIPAVAGGRDLAVAPSRVVTRLVLSPDKTKILAQAVQVIEKRTK